MCYLTFFLTGQLIQSQLFEKGKYLTQNNKLINNVCVYKRGQLLIITVAAQQQLSQRWNCNSAGSCNKIVWLLQTKIKSCGSLTIKSLVLLSLSLDYALVLKQHGGDLSCQDFVMVFAVTGNLYEREKVPLSSRRMTATIPIGMAAPASCAAGLEGM